MCVSTRHGQGVVGGAADGGEDLPLRRSPELTEEADQSLQLQGGGAVLEQPETTRQGQRSERTPTGRTRPLRSERTPKETPRLKENPLSDHQGG